jgi:Zn-dependent protease
MTVAAVPTFPCPRCGNQLLQGMLVCRRCGGLVYAQRLNEIASHATRVEQVNPIEAAMIWQQALPLLPDDSAQYSQIAERIGSLAARLPPPQTTADSSVPPQPAVVRPPDPWNVALTKTLGSMLVSIAVYTLLFRAEFGGLLGGLQFATGFVVLILIHELGHVIAMKYFGLSASPPFFIPFLGAVINLRQPPRNALEESIVGIGGPVLGTVGAIVTYLIYLQTGSELMLRIAGFGFFLNLFNMLPVPPLDGGRVTAAVSPWIWITGILGMVGLLIYDFVVNHQLSFIAILILVFALPRVKATLLQRGSGGTYYQIGLGARAMMGIAYLLLTLMLLVMTAVSHVSL